MANKVRGTAARIERQVTSASCGHILTNVNVWSHDSQWIVYDTRSDPAGAVFDGETVEIVHVTTGEVRQVYRSREGARCGAATFHPSDNRVAFILGPERPTDDWQYGPAHRQGVIVNVEQPHQVRNLDARNVTPPFTPGALRGGTHVHVFSGDGEWVSFTYDDHVLTELERRTEKASDVDQNQRNVGVAVADLPVNPPPSHPRNHAGEYFSVLVTATVNSPKPGSDEISRAYEEAWIGEDGYVRPDGTRQARSLAFLGDVLDSRGTPLTELFVVDLPDDVTQRGLLPLEGTPSRRPAPPAGVVQRRITRTQDRQFPGVQGPRHWPRSSVDGSRIAFLMRDDGGVVQLWIASPLGGPPQQLTDGRFDVASAFSWRFDGSHIAYIADGCVWAVEVATRHSLRITPPIAGTLDPRPEACVFSPDGRLIAYVRPVAQDDAEFNQIFVAQFDPAQHQQ